MWWWLACTHLPAPPVPEPALPAPLAAPADDLGWRSFAVHLGEDDYALCVPGATHETGRFDDVSTSVVDAVSAAPGGPVKLLFLWSTTGVFPMSANLPDAHSTEVALRAVQETPETWWIAAKDKDGGPGRSVLARRSDPTGEDVHCKADLSTGPERDEAASLALAGEVCRSLRLGGPAEPCPDPGLAVTVDPR